jgi:anthranilate/para-aminobenzoate synthase component I
MLLFHERLGGWTTIADTFVSFFANQPGNFWLDREHHSEERFSVIGAGRSADSIQRLQYDDDSQLPFRFRPGFVGVVHYPQNSGEIEKVEGLWVERAFVYDHDARAMFFIGLFETRTEFETWFHGALLRLALLGSDAASYALYNQAATSAVLAPADSKIDYLRKIASSQSSIAAGEVYQICLTTVLEGDFVGDPLSYFLRLRKQNPAPYAAYVSVDGTQFVSISPERFITVHGEKVLSSPIKGTRPRSSDPALDLELIEELGTDQKERAENLMIVDLIRNDLSIACDPASIRVESLLAVKSFSTLHQLVSDVSGLLAKGKTGKDALRALLPGGSMTGAPKIRAMQLLSVLESRPRAAYSGGIGWIGPDWSMDLGMVIRTAVFKGSRVSIGIGGGITSDSNPESEHDEIVLKSKALVEGLGARVSW